MALPSIRFSLKHVRNIRLCYEFNNKFNLVAIQIIPDTFLADFRPPLPNVSLGDTVTDPPPGVT